MGTPFAGGLRGRRSFSLPHPHPPRLDRSPLGPLSLPGPHTRSPPGEPEPAHRAPLLHPLGVGTVGRPPHRAVPPPPSVPLPLSPRQAPSASPPSSPAPVTPFIPRPHPPITAHQQRRIWRWGGASRGARSLLPRPELAPRRGHSRALTVLFPVQTRPGTWGGGSAEPGSGRLCRPDCGVLGSEDDRGALGEERKVALTPGVPTSLTSSPSHPDGRVLRSPSRDARLGATVWGGRRGGEEGEMRQQEM